MTLIEKEIDKQRKRKTVFCNLKRKEHKDNFNKMKYGCLKSQYNKSDPNPINHFSVAGANLKQTEKFSKTPSRHPTRTLRGSQSGAPELQRACESIREVARSYNPLLPPSWPPPPTADPNAPSTCQRRSTCPMLDKAS